MTYMRIRQNATNTKPTNALLKHYLLDMNESRDFHSDCYSEVDEIVDKIDNLIKTRIDEALKEHSADSTAHNN